MNPVHDRGTVMRLHAFQRPVILRQNPNPPVVRDRDGCLCSRWDTALRVRSRRVAGSLQDPRSIIEKPAHVRHIAPLTHLLNPTRLTYPREG